MNIPAEVRELLESDMFDPKKCFHDLRAKAEHGSPLDRGSADRYYGRPRDPHYWPMGTYIGIRIDEDQMTPMEIAEYDFGYANETDRKEW